IIFTVGLTLLTYPFFSDLLGIPRSYLLYIVPSISMPILILGLLFLTIAIVRRRVRTVLGSVSGFLICLGAGATLAVGLYDHDYPTLAIFTAVLAFSLLGLIGSSEVEIDEKWNAILWSPIPPSLGAIALFYLRIQAIRIEATIAAFLIVGLLVVSLYLALTYVRIMPIKIRAPLWTSLSIMSGLLAYFSSFMVEWYFEASVFFCFFVASWFLFPVTGRERIQLFYSPLFFSVTGFAFSSVFGYDIQSVMLAFTVLFFFISRDIKEREVERAQLVYYRIGILILVFVCLALFVLTASLELLELVAA
ncbi:MAG: hypothetical protein RTU30_12995, partial [Candidatus Thorarchaeota archaeon]